MNSVDEGRYVHSVMIVYNIGYVSRSSTWYVSNVLVPSTCHLDRYTCPAQMDIVHDRAWLFLTFIR